MKNGRRWFAAVVALATASMGWAQEGEGEPPAVYVDQANGSGPWDGASWATAFCTIQEGLDASTSGATVWVAPGTYVENVVLPANDVTLSGTNPNDWAVVEATVIDGNQAGACVAFLPNASQGLSTLRGFTLTNGSTGIEASELGAEHCIIAQHSGPGVTSAREVRYCQVRENAVGITFAGRVEACEINSNAGAGIIVPDGGEVCDSLIYGNGSDGLIGYRVHVWNTVIHHNVGNGASVTEENVVNCTIADNAGYGINADAEYCYESGCSARNTILWGNALGAVGGVRVHWNLSLMCLDDPAWAAIPGMVEADPRFVDRAQSDYRLQADSPCIDAGGHVDLATDFLGSPRPYDAVSAPLGDGSNFDIGAYEFSARGTEPPSPEGELRDLHWVPVDGDSDKDYLSDAEEAQLGLDAGNADQDGNGRPDGVDLALACADALDTLCPCMSSEPDYVVPRDVIEALGSRWMCLALEFSLENACGCEPVCALDGARDYTRYAYNPCQTSWFHLPEGAYHFLSQGSFNSYGFSDLYRADPAQTLTALQLNPQAILNLPQEGEFVPACSTVCEGQWEGAAEGQREVPPEGQPEGEGESSAKAAGCGPETEAPGSGSSAACILLTALFLGLGRSRRA